MTIPFNLLAPFPKVTLIDGPTPIQRLSRLESALGLNAQDIRLYMKHDDAPVLGGGGNKLRKLEFHFGHALANHANVIITTGGLQSNHARLTAAACARLNLRCILVLSSPVPLSDEDYVNNGNTLLNNLLGAEVHLVPPTTTAAAMIAQLTQDLTAQGLVPYFMPTGGSTATGCLGYVNAALEIIAQEQALGLTFDQVLLANGSSGTHAGLSAGFAVAQHPTQVKSYAVLANRQVTQEQTHTLVAETLALLGSANMAANVTINVDDGQLGQSYGLPTAEMKSALHCLARTEGLLLDPVYSGKAFAGLIHDLRQNSFAPGSKLLFLMTGGTPALYAYKDHLAD
ncbi:MAG: D-cysteine desulfhydrase family protein [Neisseriaceae bacterium]|nr:D-cysteine desulfhydrase family protein [Neisseriaceae bacterium]